MRQKTGRAAECSGKRQYTTYVAAQRDGKGMNRHWGVSSGDPYHCGHCHFFHIGSSMKSKKKHNRHMKKETEYGDRE